VITAAGAGATRPVVESETVTSQSMGAASMLPLAGAAAVAARTGDPGDEVHSPVVAARSENLPDDPMESAMPVIGANDELSEPPDRALTL
jgi:hypothetical protein